MKIQDSITVKILVSMSICIIFFTSAGIIGSSALYSTRLFQKSLQINEQYMHVISNQLENDIQELQKLTGLCASSFSIMEALKCQDMTSISSRRKCLDAQTDLERFSSSTPLTNYLRRCVILNQNGIRISSSVGATWNETDWSTLQTFLQTEEVQSASSPFYRWHSLLEPESSQNLSYLAPLGTVPGSYLYIELSETLLSDQLLPYQGLWDLFIIDRKGEQVLASFVLEESADLSSLLASSGSKIRFGGHTYQLSSISLSQFDIIVGSLNDVTISAGDNLYILYVLLILFAATVCAGIFIVRLLTKRITRPIGILTSHIRKISETNNFSSNPQIESSSDEIGEIGKAVNQMTSHIQTLLTEKEAMYEQKKNVEINLLQSQINPHFLYNTLDSIRWMAVIQGSKNIEQTTKALEHLLRNVAKGIDDKITLREELALVNDYIHIQKVRYVEIFDYVCNVPDALMDCLIIKFTLQPIVENAILHGIEPTGQFGQIEINARVEEEQLYISIEDNGAGMTGEELQRLTASLSNQSKNSMSGIGVSNVDTRLKLNYGPEYGLSYESSPGEYTRVTIHIPKEEAPYV